MKDDVIASILHILNYAFGRPTSSNDGTTYSIGTHIVK